MRDYKSALIVLSAVVLLFLVSSSIGYGTDESVGDTADTEWKPTPDHMYTYNVKGGSWANPAVTYTIKEERQDASEWRYTLKFNSFNGALLDIVWDGEAKGEIIVLESFAGVMPGSSSISCSLSEYKTVYFIGEKGWTVTNSTIFSDSCQIITGCNISLQGLNGASENEIICYVDAETHVGIGSSMLVRVKCDSNIVIGDSLDNTYSSTYNISFLKDSKNSRLLLPLEVYLSNQFKPANSFISPYSDNPEDKDKDFNVISEVAYYIGDYDAESVTIPSGITKLADYCFRGMGKLSAVKFNEDLISIGKGSFEFCGSLKTIDFPRTVSVIESSLFYNSGLETIEIPNTVMIIESSAFSQSSLKSITFESGGNAGLIIKESSFKNTLLSEIKFPSRTESISESSFDGTKNLAEITFDNSKKYSLQSFGLGTIPSSLTKLHIPMPVDGKLPSITHSIELKILGSSDIVVEDNGIIYLVNSDGSFSIYYTSGVSGDVVLRDNVVDIRDYAFYQSDIRSIEIPASVKSIGNYSFSNSSLESLSIADGSLLESIGNFAFTGTAVSELKFSSSLHTIGIYAFESCVNLETVSFVSAELKIGENAFRGCRSLTEVSFPNECNLSIGNSAFYSSSLSKITLPEGTVSIGTVAFAGTQLKSLTLPSSITSIGFSDKTSVFPVTMKTISVADGNTKYVSDGNVIYEVLTSGDSPTYKLAFVGYDVSEFVMKAGTVDAYVGVFKSHTSLESVTFCEGFTRNVDFATFEGCSSLTSVDMSKAKIKEIGDNSFSSTPLAKISFPSTLITIGANAFYNCSELSTLDLSGTNLNEVGADAFGGCSSLTSVSLPKTLKKLPSFADSYRLSKIVVDLDNQTLKSIDDRMVVSNSDGKWTLVKVAQNVPTDKNGLRTITIPVYISALKLDAFYNAVLDAVHVADGNSSMHSLENGAAVISSNGNVLYIASNVQSIELPGTVTSISNNVLKYATSLLYLTWGDDNTSADLSIPGVESSGLDTVIIKTKGKLSLNDISFNNLSSITIECGELGVTGKITSATEYAVSIFADSIPASSFIGGKVTSISLSEIKDGLKIGNLLCDGGYGDVELHVGGESIDLVKGLTDHTLDVVDSNGDSIPMDIVSFVKEKGKITFTFTFDYNGFTVYDVDTKPVLDISGDGFSVDMSDKDVRVVLSERETSETFTVIFDATGGVLSGSSTMKVGKGRTISSAQLESMVPTRDSYLFKGWYVDSELSQQYSKMRITSDITLYARWEPVNGHVVTIDDLYGRVTVKYSDGRLFYSGDKVEPSTKLSIEFVSGNGIVLLGWTVSKDGSVTQSGTDLSEIVVDGTISISPNMRVFSASNSLINITDLPTPEWENVTIVWQNQYDVDTSMMVWTGMPSIPLIVDDYVFVRAADTLYKLSIYTGKTIESKTVENTTSHAYYHYLGYGGDIVVDYNTQSTYDLDLNFLYKLPKAFTAVYYEDGFFYGLYKGNLWKFDSETGKLVENDGWKSGVPISWHSIYGTTSTPVFDGNWVYFVEVNGDSRMIGAVNLENGSRDVIELDKLHGLLCDDGWLTIYEYNGTKYLFVTGYTGGLFDTSSNGGKSIVTCVALNKDGTFADGSERWMYFKASAAASAFVVVDGRGYLNVTSPSDDENLGKASGAFYVVDVHKFLDAPAAIWSDHSNKVDADLSYAAKSISGIDGEQGGWIIYIEKSVSSHGSIVVSTAYKDETGKVYIYLLPYVASEQAVYIFEDWAGKTEATGYFKTSPVGQNYGSQAVRVGPNGELIWYTDSGTLWCVRGVSGMKFQFLLQDSEGAQWIKVTGTNVLDTLYSVLLDHYVDSKVVKLENSIITVDGIPLSVYLEDSVDWVSIDYAKDDYNSYRTFFVSTTIITAVGEPLDQNKVYGTYYLNENGNVTEHNLIDLMNNSPVDGFFSKAGYATVTVDPNGGVLSEGTEPTTVVAVGEKFDIPLPPSRSGYNFVGWEIGGKTVTGTVTVTKNVTLVAKWEWADKSTQVGGVTIDSDDGGFVDEPVPGKWVDYISAGYGEKSDDAKKLIKSAYGKDVNDVADRTLFLYFGQRGTTDSDTISARLLLSDGTLIYQESLTCKNTLWYVTLGSSPNYGGTILSEYYKLGGIYTMAIYVNGQLVCSADVSTADGSVSDVGGKNSSLTLSEGKEVVLSPKFFNGTFTSSNVAQTGVTWTSSDSKIVTVVNGVVTAVAPGTAVISVTTEDGGYTAYCVVTVEPTPLGDVTISNDSASINVRGELDLSVTFDGTPGVTWASSNPGVATVNGDGHVVGVSAGTAVITVTVTDSLGNSKTASCVVTVNANLVKSISIKGSLGLKVGGSETLTAIVNPAGADNTGVIWSSSNTAVVTVVNGVVTAVAPGTATITVAAADESGVTATCTVTVTKIAVDSVVLSETEVTLDVGGSAILTATVTPDNVLDKSVVWTSSDSKIVTVVNGVVTAVAPGTATITAVSSDGGKTATCTVTVMPELTGIVLDVTSVTLVHGQEITLNYALLPAGIEGYTVSWTSSDTSVAIVSNGRIAAADPGTAIIKVTVDGKQVSAVCVVTVIGAPTQIDTTTEKNSDGSETTKVTEKVDAGNGTSVDRVTETTVKDGKTSSTVTKISVGTSGSDVTTTVTVISDDSGSTVVAETTVPSTVTNGITSVSPEDMRVALEQMGVAGNVSGEDVESVVKVNLSTGKGVSGAKATLPSDSVQNLVDTGMTLVTDVGTLNVSGAVFENIVSMGGNATVSLSKVEESKVPTILDGKKGVSVFEVSLSVGGKSVHQLGGTVGMVLPYTLESGQSAGGVKVYYIDDYGNMTLCQGRYDAASQTVVVPTDHFSTFAIVYEEPEPEPEPAPVVNNGSDDTILIACVVAMGAVIVALAAMVVVLCLRGNGRKV